jgi:hypothetical protein
MEGKVIFPKDYINRLGMVAHACNQTAVWYQSGQKVSESPSQQNKLGVMECLCHPNYVGGCMYHSLSQDKK